MLRQGYRLACQTLIGSPVVVDIPEESMFETQQQILVSHTTEESQVDPVVRKHCFQLSPPSSEDPRSDLTRFRAAIGNPVVPTQFMRVLPRFLRTHNWHGTATLADHRLIALEPGDTSASILGVALDLGTTTLVGKLYDLTDGRERSLTSRVNPQVTYGDDVISRIMCIRKDPGKLLELQSVILKGINGIIADLVQQAEMPVNHIYEIAVAGNSTMQQILCGLDPSALGEVPFVEVLNDAQTLSAAALGIEANPGADVFVFPQIGGFVGGDTVAGMLAARLDQEEKPALFVDIGTNGEIVLAHDRHLLATSTAAGPAFEGARIKQGMRATDGAIEKVIVRDDILLNVIGNRPPVGICGTALIDVVAELLRARIIDETGRILSADKLPSDLSARLKKRLVRNGDETNFLLADEKESAGGEPIYLWQKDVRELQLAAGAIRAGINILLRRVGLQPNDLGDILLAGAFGNFIRRSNAQRVGLLPPISRGRIRFIGNAASLGAKLALLSAKERAYATRLQETTKHVDLSLDAEFQADFGMAMIFPDREPQADE